MKIDPEAAGEMQTALHRDMRPSPKLEERRLRK